MSGKDKRHYFDDVYDAAALIPSGRVCTYGDIANYLTLGSARMVGWALNKLDGQDRQDVPAHRVVNRLGHLSGRLHFGEPNVMADRLKAEGVEVKDSTVVNFKKLRWDFTMLDEADYL